MNVLAPGVYADVVGNIHFEVGEIIGYLGAADTPENRTLVVSRLTDEAKRLGSHVPIDVGVQG